MIELHNVDCMEYLATLEDNAFELAIVDPPYGIEIAKWDKKELRPKKEYFDELFRVSKNQIIWGGNFFTNLLPIIDGWLCWYKKPFLKQQAHFELAWNSILKKPFLFEYTYAGNCEGIKNIKVDYSKKSIHPTQKPVKLYEWLLMNYAKEGDRILDTHLGSGSIAIACHNLGFDLVGCELDTDYEAAKKRIQQHQSQLRIPMT